MNNQKTNILFILADQLRADFLSCYGADFIETPHIDSLAEQGVQYNRAISPSPLCVPARASLLTGLNSLRNGVPDNEHWLRPDNKRLGIKTWPEKLYEQGYFTSAIGKMHFFPWDSSEGFQHRVISEDKRHLYIKDDYYGYLERNGLEKLHGKDHPGYYENKGAVLSNIPPEHQVDKWVADRASEFISDYSEPEPFALMVGFPGPHCPYDPPQVYAEMFEPENMPEAAPVQPFVHNLREACINSCIRPWNGVDYREFTDSQKAKIRAHYAGLVNQIDDGVGQIIRSLKEAGAYDNTVIIFSSDHGDMLGDYGMVGKANFLESSIRVPLIISHPRKREPVRVEDVVSLTDINATILAAAGLEVEENGDNQVLPEMPCKDSLPRDYVFGNVVGDFMVAEKEWKLVRYGNGDVHLFNISDDPWEQTNLAEDTSHSSVMNRLDKYMTREISLSCFDRNGPTTIDDRIVHGRADTDKSPFGERGWRRPFPAYDE